MKTYIFLSVLISLAFGSDVLEWTDTDFGEKVAEHDLVLVEFFAPWCGHCKKLTPEYERAATILKDGDDPVALAKVDCTVHTEICSKHGVSGYPTLKIFRQGEFSEDYSGPREEAGIVKTMQGKAGPSSKELQNVEDALKFLAKSEYAVVGFFESAESELAKTFQKVAAAMSSDMRFAHTIVKEVQDQYSFSDDIVLFQPKRYNNKFEDSQTKYKDDATVDKIKSWIQDNMLGLCAHRSQNNADKFKNPLVVAYFDVDYQKNEKGTNYWRNRVMKVGKKLKDAGENVFFAISSHKEFSQELQEFGADNVGDKPVVTARDTRDRKFVMAEEFSMDNLEKFVNDMLADKLEPYMKSEALPDNTDAAVKTLVGKNFDEIVNDESKDVLIEFYAPWCGHCKSLEPKLVELAEKLKDETDIVIAKMDATANDVVKPYEVSGFPTLYFAPKSSKKNPMKYNGGREVDDFVKYLAKEASSEMKGFNRDGKKKKEKKTEL